MQNLQSKTAQEKKRSDAEMGRSTKKRKKIMTKMMKRNLTNSMKEKITERDSNIKRVIANEMKLRVIHEGSR